MDRCDLDHVALAAADTSEALRWLTGTLGGTVIFGGQATGFRPMQVWIGTPGGDGMSIELLEPWETQHNDFLARFVARHGAGPHHLTFKVPDIVAAIERFRAAGIEPVNVDLSDPEWKEAFVLPRDAYGTVVQLAETAHQHSRAELLAHVAQHGVEGRPRWWVDSLPATGPPARLRRVVLRSADPAGARRMFAGLLDGAVAAEGEHFIELSWPGGARLRIEPDAARAAGVDRLEVEGIDDEHTVIGTRFVPCPDGG
jgi:methylmalonyl-CoA/ethylmalonyl-CoA epimerase